MSGARKQHARLAQVGSNDELPELTGDQLSLLYLISRYSQAATSADQQVLHWLIPMELTRPVQEEWIRKIPLLVLIYEGIVNQVLDYDYAPGV